MPSRLIRATRTPVRDERASRCHRPRVPPCHRLTVRWLPRRSHAISEEVAQANSTKPQSPEEISNDLGIATESPANGYLLRGAVLSPPLPLGVSDRTRTGMYLIHSQAL